MWCFKNLPDFECNLQHFFKARHLGKSWFKEFDLIDANMKPCRAIHTSGFLVRSNIMETLTGLPPGPFGGCGLGSRPLNLA